MKRKKGEEGEGKVAPKIVFPGEMIPISSDRKTRIGAGLLQKQNSVVASRCGVIRKGKNEKVWIDNSQKMYMPVVEDLVVGVVKEKHFMDYHVDIGSTQIANLSTIAFEGATKRNRPNIPVGALVYARVIRANKDMEPELTCTSPFQKKEWVTGESLFGELKGGYAFECSLSLAHSLLDEACWVLQCLGRHIPFELAIGVNGKVWVNSKSPLETILITNAILQSEKLNRKKTQALVDALVSYYAKSS